MLKYINKGEGISCIKLQILIKIIISNEILAKEQLTIQFFLKINMILQL